MPEPRFHVVSSTRLDEAAARRDIAAGLRPRHFLFELTDRLAARFHDPCEGARAPGPVEGALLGLTPEQCAMIDRVAAAAGEGSAIYVNGDGVGLALAYALARRRSPARIIVFAHNLLRPRLRAAIALTGAIGRIDRLHAITPRLVDGLKRRYPQAAARILLVDEQADDRFFSPGPAHPKRRPLIVGVGLEQRDYATLAAAVRDLDVDVRISAFSKDARRQRGSLPATLPPNMQSAFYPWPDLVQLYRDADLVAVTLLPNAYAAGITTILEAAAIGRPVIATQTDGIAGVFSDGKAIAWTKPGDAAELRQKIVELLDDPARRAALAEQARTAFRARHRKDDQVAAVAAELAALAAAPRS